ncbi:MAG: FHA domain-containing protein [Magnetococcus sp. DMHC-6]
MPNILQFTKQPQPDPLAIHIKEPNVPGYDFSYNTYKKSEYLIGRATNPISLKLLQIPLQNLYVSRKHCRIYRNEVGVWMIEDLNSENGTILGHLQKHFIPFHKVNRPTPLEPGMAIQIGQVILTVQSAQAIRRHWWQFRAA